MPDDNDPIAIVGMGPGGMSTALKLAQKGKKVVIFDNRDHFSRVQQVILNSDTIKFLKNLEQLTKKRGMKSKNPNFLSELNSSNKVEIADLQEFLKEKMQQLYPGSITIKQGKHINIEAVNPENCTLSYKDRGESQKLKFSHLVAADGARHQTANLVKKSGIDIQYRILEEQPRQEAHGTVNVELRKGVGVIKRPLRTPPRLLNEDLADLRKLGWDKPYLPKLYIWPSNGGHKFYIAGEIPDLFLRLKGENRQKALDQWAQVILRKTYGYKKNQVGLNLSETGMEESDKLKATAFPVTLHYATKSAIPLKGNKHTFIQIGDACRSANFHLGHGTNDAISDGISLSKNLDKHNNQFDIDFFNKHHEKTKAKVTGAMEFLRTNKDLHEFELMEKYYKLEIEKILLDVNVMISSLLKDNSDFEDVNVALKAIERLIKEGRFGEVYDNITDVCQKLSEKMIMNPELFLNADDRRLIGREKPVRPVLEKVLNFIFGSIEKIGQFFEKREENRNIFFNKIKDETIGKRVKKTSEVLYRFQGAVKHLEDARKLQKKNRTKQEVEENGKPTKPKAG